jgi:hypothetical protein
VMADSKRLLDCSVRAIAFVAREQSEDEDYFADIAGEIHGRQRNRPISRW